MKKLLIILLSFFGLSQIAAQSNYRLIEKGNRSLGKEEYSESEIYYRKALEQDSKLTTAQYNIGNARYLQEDFEGASTKFEQSAEAYESQQDKADAYHNLGNSLLSQKKYEESIEAYKTSLKLNPSDMDTKYNLVYAQNMLKKDQEQQQQEQEQKQDENKEQEKDENKDNQNKDEQKENGEGQDEEQKENQNGDEKNEQKEQNEKEPGQKPQPKEGQLTKEQADQILKMLEGEEGKLQEKLDEPEGEAVKIIIEKDW